jgi:NDP-sugar pyrophosphorylase family protein
LKAVILAAGKGARLGELGEKTPKPMLHFRGKPILQYNIELCRAFGITEIHVNTHHLPEIIKNYFGDGSKFGVNIHYSYEPILLGTSGALNNFRQYLKDDSFFVVYGDNYSDYDLHLLEKTYLAKRSVGVIAFYYRDDVSQSGVAELSKDGRVMRFIEKPQEGATQSHWVNTGIYLLNPDILKYIPNGFSDFGKDIFPRLIRENVPLYGVCSDTKLMPFDTPEMVQQSLKHNSESER